MSLSFAENIRAYAKKALSVKMIKVWLIVAIFMFSRAFDRVLSRRWATQMENYDWMSGAIIFPMGAGVLSFILLFIFMALGQVPKESRLMMQWPFMLVAICDGTNALLDTTATSFISGDLENAITQTVIPFTMILAYFYLSRRYQKAHYLAAFLVIYGICLNIQPIFAGEDLQVKGTNGVMFNTSIWFVLLDIVAFLPAAFSNVYKEKTLKGKNVSVFWFSAFNTFYQVIWGFITIPYAFIAWPEPKGRADATPSTLGDMFHDGFSCFFGIARGPKDNETQCVNPWEWFLLYLVFNVTFNICLLKLSKEVSAAFSAVVSAGNFILTNFLFLSKDLAGAVQPLEVWTAFGMIAVALAIVIYGTHSELDKDGNPIIDVSLQIKEDDEEGEYTASNDMLSTAPCTKKNSIISLNKA